MEFHDLGAGLSALAFWGFIAAVSVAGIWDDVRKRESKHKTIRHAIEKGNLSGEELLQAIASIEGGKAELSQSLRVAALWIMPISPGAVALGFALGFISEDARLALFGVAGLTLCLGIGFLVSSRVATGWEEKANDKDNRQTFGR